MITDFDDRSLKSNLYSELRLRIWRHRYYRLKGFVLNVWAGVWQGSFILFTFVYGAWEYTRR